MKKNILTVSAALFVALIAFSPAWAADNPPDKPSTLSVSFGAEFTSGGSVSGPGVSSIYAPLIFTWFPTERIDAGIELPVIVQRGSNTSMHLYETIQNARSSMMAGQGTAGGGISMGLGDLILRFGVIALFETGQLPQIRTSAYVKAPTASEARGFGTGEYDAGVGLDAVKWLGDFLVMGDAFYNYQGKAAYLGLTDYVSYSAGIGWQVSSSLRPGLLVKGATPPSNASGDLLEMRLRLLWTLTPATSLDLFVSRGIADSSPDYGGGIALIYAF